MINLEMANKLNIKAIQEPEEKRLAERQSKNAAFEGSLYIDRYC